MLSAFVMRIYNVDYLTLWVDEYVHVDRARFFPENPLFTNDNNGILLTMFIIPLFKLFGVSEFWARFPSVIFGTLLVPAVYLFAKRFFNRNVALISATLVTFSTYLAFWSRVSRNYAIFTFFFLAFLYFLARAINADNSFKEGKRRLLNYLKLQPKFLWIALILFVLSMLSHQLAFLFVYGLMFYYFLLFIDKIFRKKADFKGIEAGFSYIFIIFSIILFVPSVQEIFKSFFLLFLPPNVATWVLPNLDRLAELWKNEPYSTFNIYNGVLKTDIPPLYWLGIAGFVCALIRYHKQAYFVTAMFGILFLAMSFVFREPSLPRYLIYIYPLFLMAIALSFDTAVLLLAKIKIKIPLVFAVIVSIIVILCLPTTRNTLKTITQKEHGQVVPRELSHWYFPDWKSSCRKVKDKMGKDDVLISTMPSYVDFYLNKESYQFRQRRYNTTTHQYENLGIDTLRPNAHSTEALVKLLNTSEKVWLLVDYYFDNVMTDPNARTCVFRNMNFEYAMSDDYVAVFSWDKNTAQANPNNVIFEFMRPSHPNSMEYQINIPQPTGMNMFLDIEGISYDNQACLRINGHTFCILRDYGELFAQNGNSRSRQTYRVKAPAQAFKQGENSVAFILNQPEKNGRKIRNNRFAVYNVKFVPDYGK
jgi:hypothetical protein